MFKEVIVVEGRDDTRRLKDIYPNILTFETGGSAINREKLDQIRVLQEKRGVIVFTDPDFPGEKIRNVIMQSVPGCKHAYIQRKDAKAKAGRHGLGVEHASREAIEEALMGALTPASQVESEIPQSFLIGQGLVGHSDSANKREVLASKLGIGYVNAKQLRNRLHMFGIRREQVIEALNS